VRGAESKERDAEVEQLLGSGRLPKGPCCHLRRFVSGMGSVKKERAAASTFKSRAPIDHHVAGAQKGVDRAPR
jgi:hypothetical protein